MNQEAVLCLDNGIEVDPQKLQPKGLVGRIMWDIAFCQSYNCPDTEAFMKLLEETAKEIIDRIKEKPEHKGRGD